MYSWMSVTIFSIICITNCSLVAYSLANFFLLFTSNFIIANSTLTYTFHSHEQNGWLCKCLNIMYKFIIMEETHRNKSLWKKRVKINHSVCIKSKIIITNVESRQMQNIRNAELLCILRLWNLFINIHERIISSNMRKWKKYIIWGKWNKLRHLKYIIR